MAKYFFSSSFLLFLGNWIGHITLNWYVYSLYHNAIYLGLIIFLRLAPISLISAWASAIADRHNTRTLLLITIPPSILLTTLLCVLIFQDRDIPNVVIVSY